MHYYIYSRLLYIQSQAELFSHEMLKSLRHIWWSRFAWFSPNGPGGPAPATHLSSSYIILSAIASIEKQTNKHLRIDKVRGLE